MFDKMPMTNVMSWTAMISDYISKGMLKESVAVFQKPLERELKPESLTLMRMLTTCTQLGDVKMGKSEMATSLVDMYAKCGRRDRAHRPFDGIVMKDVVAVIGGCSSNKFSKKALEMFFKMEAVNIKSGQLDDIEALIKFMTVEEDGVIWKVLLSACQIFDPGCLVLSPTPISLPMMHLDGVDLFKLCLFPGSGVSF
ncbi:hypothetical protein M5K25_019534 [Dendrobium thyrsiflorum]|uniref:Pentatricopeptide repeat-containing protein n=1 Tax=Dendrobium thyrsiflorum TaxID=117978 RepID=A0ABD0ULZ7_DENTH